MVAYSINSFISYNSTFGPNFLFYLSSSIYLSVGVRMKGFLKLIKDTLLKISYFIILLPIYFIGVGISRVLMSFVKEEKKNGWKKSKKLSRKLIDYEEMY